MLLCALGDLLLDVIVRLEERPVPGDDTPAETHVGAGGQAANVAAWAAALGAEARLIAKRATDPAGRVVAEEVAARGVEVLGPAVEGPTGVVVSLVSAGERAMVTDRGVAPDLRPDEVEVGWLCGVDVLHLSGYALLHGSAGEAAARAAETVRAQGGKISVDLSSASGIRRAGPGRLRARLRALAPDVVFAAEGELEALGGAPPCGELVVKRGAAGLLVARGEEREERAALPTEVVDPTGAGDALAAGFLVGGIDLGLQAAARCLATMGAMP